MAQQPGFKEAPQTWGATWGCGGTCAGIRAGTAGSAGGVCEAGELTSLLKVGTQVV